MTTTRRGRRTRSASMTHNMRTTLPLGCTIVDQGWENGDRVIEIMSRTGTHVISISHRAGQTLSESVSTEAHLGSMSAADLLSIGEAFTCAGRLMQTGSLWG